MYVCVHPSIYVCIYVFMYLSMYCIILSCIVCMYVYDMHPRTGCAGLQFAVLQGRRPALFQVVGAMSEKCPAVGRARKHWGSLLLNPKPRPPTYIHGHIYTHIVYCSTQNRAPPTTHCRDLHRLMMGASHRARNQRGIVAEELSTSTPIVLIVIHKCLRWTCILGASIGESHWWLNHGNRQ